MTNQQAQILAAFNALSADEKNTTLATLRTVTTSKTPLVIGEIAVGDTVTVLADSEWVNKDYWGMSFTVVKVAKKHFYLANPKNAAKCLWPLHSEVVKVVKKTEEEITTSV
jgi:hypothetical protein